MKIVLSVPTGFHARELLMPLKPLLENDRGAQQVTCITPGAPYRRQLFPTYGPKFAFVANPQSQADCTRLMRDLQPNVVITTTAGLDPNDVPILAAAKTIGIPTLTFIASWDNVWKMERLNHQGKPQILADRLIVWNQMMKDHLLTIFPELHPEHIAVIGAPRLDYFSDQEKIPTRQQLMDYLGFPAGNGKLIHFSTTELYPMDYVVAAIKQAADSGQIRWPLHLYASVHPGGDIARHQSLETYGATVKYSFGRRDDASLKDFLYNPTLKDIYMLVALFVHADLLINHSSTTAIESLLGDTPVINVKYGRPFDWWRWRRSMVYRDFTQHYQDITAGGATKIVTGRGQLITAVNDYLAHPELDRAARRSTAARMITTLDGSASAKVYQQITSLATTAA